MGTEESGKATMGAGFSASGVVGGTWAPYAFVMRAYFSALVSISKKFIDGFFFKEKRKGLWLRPHFMTVMATE